VVAFVAMGSTAFHRSRRKGRAFSQRMLRRPYRARRSSATRPCTRASPKCDFSANAGERPACCTTHLLETAVFVDELLARHGIVHWLDWGALLGAVREQALIPWDGDVDFGVLLPDWQPLLELAPELEEAGFHLLSVSRKVAKIAYSSLNHRGVDLYRHERRGATVHYGTKINYQRTFPASFVDHLETVHLYARPFPAPSPVVPFLVHHRYGPTWNIPLRRIEGIPYPDLNGTVPSPTLERLLIRMSNSQRRLLAAKARLHPTRSKFWSRYGDPGLPTMPRSDFVGDVLEAIPPDQRNAVVEEFGVTVAALEQATAEIENPDMDLRLWRTARTASSVAGGISHETRRRVRAMRRRIRRYGGPVRKYGFGRRRNGGGSA